MENITNSVPPGPYRATHLWNGLLYSFRNGMHTRTHRKNMRTYDDCFSASDAVSWMHKSLRLNPNFGQHINRVQTIQLLRKFHRAGIFEEVRGPKHNKPDFDDNARLYRFIHESPKKTPRRQPLAPRTAMMNAASSPNLMNVPLKPPRTAPVKALPQSAPEAIQPARSRFNSAPQLLNKVDVTEEEIHDLWRSMTLSTLEKLLCIEKVDSILDINHINTGHIIHNMVQVNKKGLVSNIDRKDLLPLWVLEAMRTLAYWPHTDMDPSQHYPGMERDVFRLVKEYFESITEPLCTFNLYHTFVAVMSTAESLTHDTSWQSYLQGVPTTSFSSVENLINNLTFNSQHGDLLIHHDQPDQDSLSRRRLSRFNSSASLPGARFETSFSVDNNDIKTRVSFNPEGGSVNTTPNGPCVRCQDNRTPCSVHAKQLHRSVSLTKVDNIVPFPENGLAYNSNGQYSDRISQNGAVNGNSYRNRRSSNPGNYKDFFDLTQNHREISSSSSTLSSRPDAPPPYVAPPSYNDRGRGQNDVIGRQESKRSVLAESYRMAVENSPIAVSLFGPAYRSKNTSPGSFSSEITNRTTESLQLALLLLPPANRRKLHLLLRLMNKLVNNDTIELTATMSARKLALQTFTRCILRCHAEVDNDEIYNMHIVAYMVDHYQQLMQVPEPLKTAIEKRVSSLKQAKTRLVWNDPTVVTYCEQVSVQEFERQKMTASQCALLELLDGIISSSSMTEKDKNRRLKQFQKNYPDIYTRRFPNGFVSNTENSKPKIKQPLLRKPLQKLRNLRL